MTRKTKAAELPVQERIYLLVAQIPPGQVASYGQIAFLADVGSARRVGRALAELPEARALPWHRVINSQGRISARKDGGEGDLRQKRRLQAEGVVFDNRGCVDFAEVGWPGPPWEWLEANGFDLDALALKSQGIKRRGAWTRWRL